MSAPTRSIKAPQSFQDSGTVLRVEGDRVVVRGAAAEFHCRRAVSCVVDPRPDDLVLFAAVLGVHVEPAAQSSAHCPRMHRGATLALAVVGPQSASSWQYT